MNFFLIQFGIEFQKFAIFPNQYTGHLYEENWKKVRLFSYTSQFLKTYINVKFVMIKNNIVLINDSMIS